MVTCTHLLLWEVVGTRQSPLQHCTTRSVQWSDWADDKYGGYRAVVLCDVEWNGCDVHIPKPHPKLCQKDLNAALAKMAKADRKCVVIPLTAFYTARELDV